MERKERPLRSSIEVSGFYVIEEPNREPEKAEKRRDSEYKRRKTVLHRKRVGSVFDD